ncbi:tetratricopeptide repeat protein [Gracilimonas sp. Q87]|uniref:type IX secretion system periplasmic lipoprotein PorW/SprE n=1 Tax=Gracilimonas sp. Q87 TaxID=3384766 RepID=UPI0039845661
MGFRNLFLWVLMVVLFAGCSTSLRSNWKNFNAYYNTFYNAKKSYKAGLEKNVSQPRDYNPLIPIRIHEQPVNAGYQEFERAIQKSADILRKHRESKWVDDALFLIGRSYYYQQEFYSADQKFDELYLTTQEQKLQKEAVLWKSRTFLDMGLNSEGIAYVSDQLNSDLEHWDNNEIAELRTLLAQHFVALENWSSAEEALRESVPFLDSQSLKSRGYFLLGQVYEELGIYETAYGVYDRVKDHYTDYRLQYLAQRKKAELAREMGRNDIAADIFNEMLRDDKNLDYLSELDFELARTEHQRGNFERAQTLYKRVLHANNAPVNPAIRARSYNGLAEIYRYSYDDFMMAAVYYDSAAQVNVSRDLLPESFRAEEYANSFGTYSRIKSKLSRQDSLLELGLMSDEELDSVVTVMRRQKILELQKQRQERGREDRLMTVEQPGSPGQRLSGRNGFLNTNNPELQESVKQQFYMIWGDRPLTDNWRVQSLISTTAVDGPIAVDTAPGEETILLDVEIDLSEIPFTENEQDSIRKNMSSLQYELGNLMYLSMDMPDSAAYYFQKAIENPSEDRINMVSLYSLSELYENAGDAERSMEYANRLLQEYPNSSFAMELRGESRDTETNSDSEKLIDLFISLRQNDSLSTKAKADSLKKLSLSFSDQQRSDLVLYESLQLYLQTGSTDSLYNERITAWHRFKDTFGSDSAFTPNKVSFSDILALEKDSSLVSDSLRLKTELISLFPYQNAAFDSARAITDIFLSTYPNSSLYGKVKAIQDEIKLPELSSYGSDEENQVSEPDAYIIDLKDEGYVNCEEIDRELKFRSGKIEILSLITDSEELDSVSIKFRVNHRGLVDSYALQTEEVTDTTSNELDMIIRNNVVFEPTIYQASSVPVVCTVIMIVGQ